MPDFPRLLALSSPFGIVCHDAGAANQLFAWLDASGRMDDARVVAQGPAKRLWMERGNRDRPLSELAQAFEGVSAVISGTGWSSNLEHKARTEARGRGLHSIAVIDHWTNYYSRFVRSDDIVLPDEIWVSDAYAKAHATTIFPDIPIFQLPDSYLQENVKVITKKPTSQNELLYILEPLRDSFGRERPGEFQALDFFLDNLAWLNLPENLRIRLRMHPSEEREKYLGWLSRRPEANIELAEQAEDLATAISRASWVAGCQSYAMVVALAACRTVICTLPPWAPPSKLPHEHIIQLRQFSDPT